MKKLFCFFLILFCSLRSIGQKVLQSDSLYYLIDFTEKSKGYVPLWDVSVDYPIKSYQLQSDLPDGIGKPVFNYNMKSDSSIVKKKAIKKLNPLTLTVFLSDIANYFNTGEYPSYKFFLIEPVKKRYVVHQVYLLPKEKVRTIYDNLIIIRDTSKGNN